MRRILACLLIVALVMICVLKVGEVEVKAESNEVTFSASEGYEEGAFAKWMPVTGAESYKAYVSTDGNVFTAIDDELIRVYEDYVRVDAVGLAAGSYVIKVEALTGGNIIATGSTDTLNVINYDRSGYAHFNNTEGVGAYNDDGTLKENAIVLYVTDENKDTISVTASDGTTVTGIGQILNSGGRDVGTGLNGNGGLANKNEEIIRKLADDGQPIVVRIIGNVTAPDGLTAYGSIDYGGAVDGNGNMARIKDGINITIEGIGSDAVIDGWGIHFIATKNYLEYGKNFEVRNITFRNVPEDCLGIEGTRSGTELVAPVERCWVHDCEFYGPTIENPVDWATGGGDGACDFKRGQYYTLSYCYFEDYDKANLVGASEADVQYHVTFHHNYWKDCLERSPLSRQVNMHMYNNLFEGQTSYCMNTRADAYIFSEYNFFYKSKDLMKIETGVIKSYNDVISGSGGRMDGTVVTDKNTLVDSKFVYGNFETSSTLSYIPTGDYDLQEDVTEAKKVIMAKAGVLKENPVEPWEVTGSVVKSDRVPSAALSLPYSKNLNNTYLTERSTIVDNIVFNIRTLGNDALTLGGTSTGQDIVFRVNTAVNITLVDGGASYPVGLFNEAGVNILTGSGTVTNVPAGTYIIQSADYISGRFTETKIASLAIEAYDPSAPTVTEYDITVETDGNGTASANMAKAPAGTTVTLSTTPNTGYEFDKWQVVSGEAVISNNKFVMPAGAVVIKAIFKEISSGGGETPGGAGETPGGGTTGGVTGEAIVHNFTTDGKISDFFTISGNLATNKGTVTYDGLTLTQCLKMESETSILFTAAKAGKLTLVFNSDYAKEVKIDGTNYTATAGIVTVDLEAGAHTITKDDMTNLFYIVLEYYLTSGGDEPIEPVTDPVESFVERMYTVALNRPSDAAGKANWVYMLKANTHDGAGLAAEFILGEEFELRGLTDEQYVDVLYQTFFGRAADSEGKNLWVTILGAGQSREYILSQFVNLNEFTILCESYGINRGVMLENGMAANPGVPQFVKRLYELAMGRAADAEGLYFWTLSLSVKAETAESAAKFFFGSDEYAMKNTDNVTYVSDLYKVFMNREADAEGLSFWVSCIEQYGMTRDDVLSEFAKSDEFKAIAASYGLE